MINDPLLFVAGRRWCISLAKVTKRVTIEKSKLFVVIKFSPSNNAVVAFWLVHGISVTSHYTCVWPYMEMNVANVARHKIFAGSQVSSTKKWKKKIWWAIYRRNTSNYGQCRTSNNKKSHEVRDKNIQRYVSVIFTFMLLNGLLVLVAPNFRNQ